MAERLLDDDARVRRQAGLGEALDDPCRRGTAGSRGRRPGARRRSIASATRSYVAASREVARARRRAAPRSASNTVSSSCLAGAHDRLAGALDELVDRPVVDRDADDRAVEQPALLEPVQRAERHHLRQVAGDPEDHEDVRRLRAPSMPAPWRAVRCPSPLSVSLTLARVIPRRPRRVARTVRDPAGALVRERGPGPVDDRLGAVLVRRQQREVHGAPREPAAFRPFIVRPPSICTTAAPRPIVAIVPLSLVLERLGLLARDAPGDRLAGVLARLERDRAELGQDLLRSSRP